MGLYSLNAPSKAALLSFPTWNGNSQSQVRNFRTWSLELPLLFSRFEGIVEGAKGRSKGVLSEYRDVMREQRGSKVNL